ncbi:DUF6456 domain-containing protein [Microvirga sp. G4-2]|uniref:DUF6456 domain-containing protein n=1 Tax=Microvirga sp. G4-2 TaxID=3434467 RepID=UPI0040448DA6
MNKNETERVHETIAPAGAPVRRKVKKQRYLKQVRGAIGPVSMAPTSETLRREAGRLLAVLDVVETRVMVDPTDDGSVIVHRKRAGISVGAGRFNIADAEMLVRQDLAHWQRSEAGQRMLILSEAGRSYLRRASADEPEAAFLHQHRETVTATIRTGAGLKRVRMDAEESPLDWLHRRRNRSGEPMIDEAAYQAGERLRTDIMLAGLLPGVTARWDAMPTGGGSVSPSEATDRMIAARQRIRHAFDAVGSDFSDLLMDLCGFLKGLEQIERERGWPPRSAKIVVRLALARLAEHYGIEAVARGPAASRGIKTWRAVVIEGGRA